MMSDWDSGRPSAGHFDVPRPPWLDGATYSYPLPFPLAQALEDDEKPPPAAGAPGPGEGELPDIGRPPWEIPPAGWADQFAAPPPDPATAREPYYPAALRGAAADGQETPDWAAAVGRHRRGGRRWLVPAGVVTGAAVAGAAAIALTGGHRSVPPGAGAGPAAAIPVATARATATARMAVRIAAKPGPAAAAPLTLTQAQAVLARYTSANNTANAQRSETLLATVEGGSSDAIDAGQYRAQRAAGTAPYPPFSPVQATYYLPAGEPAGGPRWFAVQVANAFTSSPSTVTSEEYLLFTQSAPGGPWVNTTEPYLLASATAPQVEVGADGLATAVSPGAATVAVAPGQLPAVTAASLDGTRSGEAAVADPGNLADLAEERHWQRELPGAAVTDTHMAAAGADGQEFALLTAGGGALVFYSDAAEVTVTPPAGSVLRLNVPGFFSAGQALAQARLGYTEQFAAYDPPAAAGGPPRVVADYSGITGTS